MITIGSLYEEPQALETMREFTARFGGKFLGHVPGGRLFYIPEGGENSRLSPYEETVDTVLQTLRDSITSNRNLIEEHWPFLEYEPGCVY